MKYLDTQKRGKFFVIYGSNNIGKSTQVGMLSSKIVTEFHEQLLVVKYPIYELKPTGERIWQIVKNQHKKREEVNDLQLQILYAQNRRDFQSVVENCLISGIHVIAEDYIGTGIAWGITKGLHLKELLKINNLLLMPDLAILMDGKRFSSSIEKHHIFENSGDAVWNKNREIHLYLAKKFGWKIVKSDDLITTVHNNIWKLIGKKLK